MFASDIDRQILFGLMAIQLKLVTVAHASRALAEWSVVRDRSLKRILIDQKMLDEPAGDLVESVVGHQLSLAGGNAGKSLESFAGSDALEALRGVVEQTLRPPATQDATIVRSDARPSALRAGGNGWSAPVPGATFLDHDQVDRSLHTMTEGGVSSDGSGYEILRLLARGGLGEVFVARDGRLNREVALKLIQESQAGDAQSRARFLLEAEITGGLEHPGIVPVYALGENSDGRPFYAMRLVRGETLKERIRKVYRTQSKRPLARELRQLLNHFVRLSDIVAYAHSRGVLHRDLKPSNVMLGKFGETLLVDWGLAKPIERTAESPPTEHAEVTLRPVSGSSVQGTMPGAALGTPQYMSPEQAMGQLDRVGPASDVYSLGATLYCILTGGPPLAELNQLGEVLRRVSLGDIPSCRTVRPDAPATLAAICGKAMSVRPEDRYASPQELGSDIESWLADEAVSGVREPLGARLGRWERRHRTFLRVSGLALVTFALVAIAAALGVNTARQRADERRKEALVLSKVAETRKQEADSQRDALQRLTTRLTLDRGLSLVENRDHRAGLLWLARSLQGATDQDQLLEPAIRGNLAAWSMVLHRLRDCIVHQGPVRAVAWSPTGRSVASGGEDGIVHVRDPSTGEPLCPPLKHGGPVRSLAYTRDGKTLATASDDGTARLWNTSSGSPRGEPMKHGGPVTALAISPDDATVVTASGDGLVRLWDIGTGQLRGQPLAQGKPLVSVVIAPDGKSIASIDETGCAIVWDVPGAKPRMNLSSAPGAVRVLAFGPDSSKLGYGGDDGRPRLLDAITGKELPLAAGVAHQGPIQALAFSHDGTKVATGSYDTSCRIWNVRELTPPIATMQQRGHVWAIAFSPDDSLLAAAADDNTTQLWYVTKYKPAGDPLPHHKPVRAVAFSPDGRSILTGADDGVARIWQLGSDGGIGQPMKHTAEVRDLAARPDSKAIATVSFDGVVWLWDAVTTRPIAHSQGHPPGINFELAFNPAGTVLVTSAADGSIRRWNGGTLEPIGPAIQMTSWVRRIAISPDGATLAACETARRIGFWDLRTGLPLTPPIALPHTATALAFNHDSTRLAVGDAEGEIQVWDTSRFRPVGEPMRHKRAIRDITFSPDGTRLATASYDKTARLWDTRTCLPLGAPMSHRAYVWTIHFSPDGERILTGSFDGTARIWSGRTASPLGQTMNHGDLVYNAIFNDDASLVLTHGRSGTARLWDAASARPVGPGFSCGDQIDAAAFLAGRPVVAIASRDRFARLWSVPTPMTGDPGRIAERTTVITGMDLGEHDDVRLLDVSDWTSRRDALERAPDTTAP
jgi:WD40 repeat protein/serine/threonine protein kinase